MDINEATKLLTESYHAGKTVKVTFTKADEEMKHSPPVKLKNKFFFRPFE